MQIEIDDLGLLSIFRRGKLKEQYCPFTPGDESNCGDWCPLFSVHEETRTNEAGENYTHKELRLCKATYVID